MRSRIRGDEKRVEETIREGKAASDLLYRARLLERRELWGLFPVRMRPFYLAQRKLCAICFERLELEFDRGSRATWDHVIPRSRGGGGHDKKNKVIAHQSCNQAKGNREPTVCEILFCTVTNEIVFSLERAL